MSTPFTDLRHGLRVLRHNPAVALPAVLTLAIGIGACTALYSVVHAVLWKALPFPEPERLVRLYETNDRRDRMNVPEANFLDWREQATHFEAMACFNRFATSVLGGEEPTGATVSLVSRGFFDILGQRAAIGRTLLASDHDRSAPAVVVVSHGFWQRQLGGATDLGSRTLTASGQTLQVVGVMPEGFGYPVGVELWGTAESLGPVNPSRSAHNWRVLARLAPGVSLREASRELDGIAVRIHRSHADVTATGALAVGLHEQLTAHLRPALLLLMGAAGILLLIACLNVMNLLLGHFVGRRQELAVRSAVGAGRWRLLVQLLGESLLLAIAGSVAGAVLADVVVRALLGLYAGELPTLHAVRTNGGVLFFAGGCSLAATVLVGLFPALCVSEQDTMSRLGRAGRSLGGRLDRRARGVLVVVQVALAAILVIGAGLLGRSFWRLAAVDLGFVTDNRAVLEISNPNGSSDAAAVDRWVALQSALLERLARLPGVVAVGGMNAPPLSGRGANGRILIEGRGDSGEVWPEYRAGGAGYFEAMAIPVVEGRVFDRRDDRSSPHVAVISQLAAKRLFPHESPLGRRINTGNMDGDDTFMSIVGVVGDVRHDGPGEEATGTVYVHHLQRPAATSLFSLVLQTAGDPGQLAAPARATLRALDPTVPSRFVVLADGLHASVASQRFNLVLLAAFGIAALGLAAIGTYSVVAYSVRQRRAEMGLRMALGAAQGDVVRLVVRQAARLVAVGLVAGLLTAVALARLLASLLHDVSPTDGASFLAAGSLVAAIGFLAGWIPARAAGRVDPSSQLRHE